MNRSAAALPLPGRARLTALLAIVLACLALLPARAMASCNIEGQSAIAFGNVNSSGATTSGTVSIVCDNGASGPRTFRACLYMNPNAPTGIDPRRMQLYYPPDFLDYDMYSDPPMTRLVGTTTSGHPIYSVTLTASSQGQVRGTMPLYLRVPPQNVTAGNYESQITSVLRSAWLDGTTAPPDSACNTPEAELTNYLVVTATFADSCYISAATDLDFGSVVSLAGNRDQSSTISLRCPTATSYKVALDYGSNSGGGTTRRLLGPGGNTVVYELYRDPGRSSVWGDTSSGNVTDGVGDGAVQTLTVYGRVPPQSVGAPGTYSDVVTVTLTF